MKENLRLYQLFAVILFGCLLVLPMLQLIFHILPDKQVTGENRALAEMPSLHFARLDDFPIQYDCYVNDHFPCRTLFLNTYFDYSLLNHQSPIPSVIIGKDDFLFCGKEEQELYEGTLDFTDEQMTAAIDQLITRHDSLIRMGIPFYVFFAPTSLEIYPEYLPKYIQRAQQTATERFCELLHQRAPQIPAIYLKSTLLSHKADQLLYYKNDNHWNAMGGYYGASQIFRTLSQDFQNLPCSLDGQFAFTPTMHEGGNLLDWLSSSKLAQKHIPDKDFTTTFTGQQGVEINEDHQKKYQPTPGFAYPWEYERRFHTNRADHPKVIIIRDSYTNALIPYLSPYFRESLFIFDAWQYQANWDIIQQEKPDLVLLVIYEPHIRNLAK